MIRSLQIPALLLCFAGCGGKEPATTPAPAPDPGSVVLPPFEPAAATVHRLTDAEWRNSVEDLLGVRFEGSLPVDYVLHGYTRVGASELTVGPLDLEQYESAAWTVASIATADGAAPLVDCSVADPACARSLASQLATRAWRRPVTSVELDGLEAVATDVAATLDETVATRAIIAAVLLSPDFLFRVETGEASPDHPGWRRYTSVEMAGRLASFVTASLPDDALLQAGVDGDLLQTDALLDHTRRLLDTPRGRAALSAFFAETLELQDLETVSKDESLYPLFTDDLRAEMALELRLLFEEVALDNNNDLGDLLTTQQSYVGPALSELYGLPRSPGVTSATIPPEQGRGGVLGRAGFLALQSHFVATSPTLRGKFVQTRLLCRSIPPPPPGVNTTLEVSDEGTLRDRLEQHVSDPTCNSCHQAMDPLGFALEHFDAIGARRELDNGLPIDATGALNGVSFDGAAQLGEVVAAHPAFAECMALQLYRSASGQAERDSELAAVSDLTEAFVAEGRVLRALVEVLVTSDAFRLASGPLQETCTDEGSVRECSTPCGSGEEVCADGRWRGCTAAAPGLESCNNTDDDCDGLIDESVESACVASSGPGTQTCSSGAWDECVGPGPTGEVCNGADDDNNGQIDDGLEVGVLPVSYAALTAANVDCDALVDADSAACRSAVHRTCSGSTCSVAGFGPVVLRASDADLVCLDSSEATALASTFTALSAQHAGCNAVNRQGPDCNAAVHRTCAGLGMASGYGPVENFADDATIVCTPGADVLEASYAGLSVYEPACNGSTQRAGAQCSRAISAFCVDQGYEAGHGPVENSGDLAIVACLGSP